MTLITTPSSSLDPPPSPVTTRRIALVASVLWLGVAASTATFWDSPDNWRLLYAVYSLLLMSAAGMTAVTSIRVVWKGSCAGVAHLGAALTVLAVCSTFVAWAMPFWMLSIAIGYGVFAIGAPEHRQGLVLLALAQLAGFAIKLAGEAVGVGSSDEFGNHPAAELIAVTTTALLTAGALILLARGPRRSGEDPATQPVPVR